MMVCSVVRLEFVHFDTPSFLPDIQWCPHYITELRGQYLVDVQVTGNCSQDPRTPSMLYLSTPCTEQSLNTALPQKIHLQAEKYICKACNGRQGSTEVSWQEP